MKNVIVISLVLVYAGMLFVPIIPYVDYAMHKEHIVMHHCENPDTDCEGFCYVQNHIHDWLGFDTHVVQQIFQIVYLEEIKTLFNVMPQPKLLASIMYSDDSLEGFVGSPFEPPKV